MKAAIQVKDRGEAERVNTAMEDPTTRAIVNVIGALMPLSERSRRRVLNHVQDMIAEQEENGKPQPE